LNLLNQRFNFSTLSLHNVDCILKLGLFLLSHYSHGDSACGSTTHESFIAASQG
jgi:hypothetical protein